MFWLGNLEHLCFHEVIRVVQLTQYSGFCCTWQYMESDGDFSTVFKWVCFSLLFVLSFTGLALAVVETPSQEPPPILLDLEKRVIQLEAYQLHADSFLEHAQQMRKEMTEELERHLNWVEREREGFFKWLGIVLAVVGGIGGLIAYGFGRDYQDTVKRIEKTAQAMFEQEIYRIRNQTYNTLKQAFDKEIDTLKEDIQHLREVIERERKWRDAKIAFVCSSEERLADLENREILALKERGLNIHPVLRKEAFEATLSRAADIIVYDYNDEDGEEALVKFVRILENEFMMSRDKPPVIIYTAKRLEGEVIEKLTEYEFVTYAQTRPTLVQQTFLQAFVLVKTKGEET